MQKSIHVSTVLFVLFANGCQHGDIVDSFQFTENIAHVDADVEGVRVKVVPSGEGTSQVDVDFEYWGSKAEIDVWTEGSILKVRNKCRFVCSGDIEIMVPADATIDASVDSGNIKLVDMDNDISASADSGNVTVENVTGELVLRAESGKIIGRALSSPECDARVKSGNIILAFVEPPENVNAEANSGNVKLTVPTGRYNIQMSAESGRTSFQGVIDDPSSSNNIHAKADSGNVSILGF